MSGFEKRKGRSTSVDKYSYMYNVGEQIQSFLLINTCIDVKSY